jgi:hypothetical protein
MEEPGLHDVPDMTGHRFDFGYIVKAHSGYWQPTHRPSVGDVVVQLESCGMGMSVRRDIRWRVVERIRERVSGDDYNGKTYPSLILRNEAGEERRLLCLKCFAMRGVKRTWVWND